MYRIFGEDLINEKFQVVVKCSLGIHARPAAQIAQACSNLRAAVTLEVDNETAQGNNVLEILNLHAPKGATVNVTVDGPDEEEAAREIQAVFDAMGPKEKKGSVLKVAFSARKTMTASTSASSQRTRARARTTSNSSISRAA